MRASWILFGVLLAVAFAGVLAGPLAGEETDSEKPGAGWKTYHAIKSWFKPVTNYFKGLPEKTPSEVADDVKEKVTDIKDWAKENDAIQALIGALVPVKDWLREKADVLQDKTFKEMYDDVASRVTSLDEHIATLIRERNAQQKQL